MKKIVLSLLFSGSVLANSSQQEQQINMMLAMMENMGEMTRLAECVDIPKTRLKSLLQQTLTECGIGDITAEESEQQHTACLHASLERRSGVPADRWLACDNSDEEQEDPLLAELDALTERIGEREPTAAEQREMDQIIERMQQRGVAELEQMVDGMIAGSQGSEDLVTLPVFPEAKLLINIPAQGEIEIAEKRYVTLPGASFVTTASPAEVLAFYRRQLPDYQEHRPSLMAATDVAYMQQVPAGFDYVKDVGRAMSIPHIFIQPASKQEQRQLAGAKTLFFVYYPSAD
ncbi:hypothetical protein [Arsukibacterium indicum]|uniref:Uncharacterized protein n=1 Tax=Arsukibacterium indicum TaxID=2848612 RepID=A0ABS6MKD2_9GAMM|nr:hypothetical protein [Arsukibacterium indicum]MBV2129263.1 hypothetical protein [Arsukibacterium indicum]